MKRKIFVILLLLSTLGANAETYEIDVKKTLRTNEGWGVSLCWWAVQCGKWPEEQLDSLIDWLVSPDGLNYNVFRYNIGGGDDPEWRNCDPHHFGAKGGKGLRAEIEGFQDGPGMPYVWTRDESQRRIMLMIKKKRPDAVFEAFSNSAPWWMTISGCCAGAKDANHDNVAPEMYETFCRYLVDVCKHYKEAYGIEFKTLDPFNEPVTNYWYQNGGQEGCHFDTKSQIELVKILYPMIQEAGLSTVISAPDETKVETAIYDIKEYAKAGVLGMVGQWNTHTYQGSIESKVRLRQLCDSLNIRLWQSETGDGGRGIHGNLKMAQRLVDDIRYLQPSVWCDWQYVEENYDQWSLVACDHQWGKFRRHANYYVRQMFSRFIPVGYKWLDIDDKHGLAAISPDGKTVVYVTLNTSMRGHRNINLKLPKKFTPVEAYRTSRTEHCAPIVTPAVSKSGRVSVALPPLSVVSIIMKK